MKKLILKIKNIFDENKGVTLLESIISIFVFALMIVAVTVLIVASLTVTSNYIQNARAHQINANDAVLELLAAEEAEFRIFSVDDMGDEDDLIDVRIDVLLMEEGNITAFFPEVTP